MSIPTPTFQKRTSKCLKRKTQKINDLIDECPRHRRSHVTENWRTKKGDFGVFWVILQFSR